MIKLFPLIILILLTHTLCAQESSVEKNPDLSSDLEELYSQGYIAGFSVAIVDTENVHYENGLATQI